MQSRSWDALPGLGRSLLSQGGLRIRDPLTRAAQLPSLQRSGLEEGTELLPLQEWSGAGPAASRTWL